MKNKSIDFTQIQDTYVDITYEYTNAGDVTVLYGESSTELDKKIIFPGLKARDVLKVEALKPGTVYYFQLMMRDKNGAIKRSDIFSFKTALTETVFTTQKVDFNLYSNNLPLATPTSNEVLIPTRKKFTLSINLADAKDIKSITAILRRRDVLGFTTLS